jgi:hypothetical protein
MPFSANTWYIRYSRWHPTRLYRAGRKLEAGDNRIFRDLRDALQFERQYHLGGDFRILLHRQADLLDRPPD